MNSPPRDYLRQDFDYFLPPELIAQSPAAQRRDSRLLYVGPENSLQDLQFQDFPTLLRPGDLLVFNDTRVIKARLFGKKPTGGRVELLLERLTGPRQALAHLRASNPPKPGQSIIFTPPHQAQLLERNEQGLVLLEFNTNIEALLADHGQLPLPPYITHQPTAVDEQRYQTVYAQHAGAVAAPTAGLHFDEDMLALLSAQGINQAFVTLHVGAGTFQPVRSERIADHRMHAEQFFVPAATMTAVRSTRERGGRVIAVGTTSVRALESAARIQAAPAQQGPLTDLQGESQLFITPGFEFQCVDALLTNFHLPQSTLLMLVSALTGTDRIMTAYEHAVTQHYRFFSYGDAMFIERPQSPSI